MESSQKKDIAKHIRELNTDSVEIWTFNDRVDNSMLLKVWLFLSGQTVHMRQSGQRSKYQAFLCLPTIPCQ